MTGGHAIVRSLESHGVDTVFGIPGVQMDHFFNALYDERNRIRTIHTRHEQGAGYMAFGYAAASGRPGVCAVVPGPGILNASAALATAYACNAPVLCIAGQIPSRSIGRGVGMLHEIPDQLAVLRGLTKWAERIDDPSRAPALVGEAFRQLATGRPRPVALEMALDVLADETEVELIEPVTHAAAPGADPDRIDEAARMLGAAERPLIFAGGGTADAGSEVQALAEALQAPVVLSRGSLGAVDDRHYLVQSPPGGHRLWAEADVVLGIGTRLNPQIPTWGLDDRLKIIRIDIDPVEITRVHRPAVGIVGDAAPTLAALTERIGRYNRKRDSREDELRGLKAEMRAEFEGAVGPQLAYLDAIRAELPEDGIFVEDLTQVTTNHIRKMECLIKQNYG